MLVENPKVRLPAKIVAIEAKCSMCNKVINIMADDWFINNLPGSYDNRVYCSPECMLADPDIMNKLVEAKKRCLKSS